MVIEVTVTLVVPVMPFSFAVTVTALFLEFFERRTPLLFTIAICGALVRQETPESTCCEPSLKWPIAVSWIRECGGTIGLSGEIVIV